MTYSSHRLEVCRCLVLKVIRVLDLPWLPNTLVSWVVDEGRRPFALIVRVFLGRFLPFATTRCLLTLRIRYAWRNPVTIFFVIPVFWLLSFRIWDHGRLVVKPIGRFGSFFVHNLERGVLIPVIWLLCIRIWDPGLINPILRLHIFRIFNLLFRIDRRGEFFEEATILHRLPIDLDHEGLVWLDDEGV